MRSSFWKFLGNLVSATTMCFFQTGESGEENISDDDLLIRIPSEYGNFDVVIRVPSERLYEELHVFLHQSLLSFCS